MVDYSGGRVVDTGGDETAAVYDWGFAPEAAMELSCSSVEYSKKAQTSDNISATGDS